MKIIELSYPEEMPAPARVVFALGFFDGLHRGHQAVIECAREMAMQREAELAVMTFDPHPKALLSGKQLKQHLTPLQAKSKQFENLGIERLYVVRFHMRFAQLTPEQFIQEILLPLGTEGVVTGFNFHFGKGGQASGEDLARLAGDAFPVQVVSPVMEGDSPISSTRIRQALTIGKVEEAKELLGRPYSFYGKVIPGDQRGRMIGFPTANLEPTAPYLIPRQGVYVVRATVDGKVHSGMMNIGMRPTFDHPEPRQVIEVHLFQFTGDLYGKEMEIACLHFLRPEQKFASVDQLIQQLEKDQQAAEKWLATCHC
jgi:riboflavin kinase/FMN adenylyltransferase